MGISPVQTSAPQHDHHQSSPPSSTHSSVGTTASSFVEVDALAGDGLDGFDSDSADLEGEGEGDEDGGDGGPAVLLGFGDEEQGSGQGERGNAQLEWMERFCSRSIYDTNISAIEKVPTCHHRHSQRVQTIHCNRWESGDRSWRRTLSFVSTFVKTNASQLQHQLNVMFLSPCGVF